MTIELETSRYGYVILETSDYLAALGDYDETLTAAFNAYLESSDSAYADYQRVTAWLVQLTDDDGNIGDVTGLYDEPGAWHLGSTYNFENNLSDDIILTLAHTVVGDLLIVHGSDFSYSHGALGYGHTGIYSLNNGDDTDIVTLLDRAYLTHSTPDTSTAVTLTGETVPTGCNWAATLEDSRWSVDNEFADYPGSDPASIFQLDSLEWNENRDAYECPNCHHTLGAYALTS